MVKVVFIDTRGGIHERVVRHDRVAHCVNLHERQGMEYLHEEVL